MCVCACACVGVAPYPTFRLVWRCRCLCNAAKSSPQFVVINANMSCGLRCVLFVCLSTRELGVEVEAAAAANSHTLMHVYKDDICMCGPIYVSVANKSNSKLPVLWILMRPAGLFLASPVCLAV